MILDRLETMATIILKDYEEAGANAIHIICILKGGFNFAVDLFNKLSEYSTTREKHMQICIDFISANTYVNDSVGHDTKLNPCTNMKKFKDKYVLIAEDLVDTGTTFKTVENYIKQFEPKLIRSASFSTKIQTITSPGYNPDYVGFEVPNRFVVGYGIDYNDCFRDVPHVCSVNDEGKREFFGKG
ncbi:unnamed protein product [Schistosoma turkestanicum]|nr:unnamed protein product [Schistosoma turkestanicum]